MLLYMNLVWIGFTQDDLHECVSYYPDSLPSELFLSLKTFCVRDG